MLELEPAADPAEAGHGLVRDPVGAGLAGERRHLVLVVGGVVDAALAVVEQDRGAGGQLGACAGRPFRSRRRVRLAGDPGPGRRGQLVHGGQPRRCENPLCRRQPAMPLGLHRQVAGQAGAAVVGPFPGGQGSAAGEGLAQGQDGVVGLARADEEPHGTGPVLAVEGDADQVLGRLVALGPVPALVEDGGAGGPADRLDDLRMTVPERRGGVARVDDLAAVGEPEPGPVAAHHPQVLGLSGGQAGSTTGAGAWS